MKRSIKWLFIICIGFVVTFIIPIVPKLVANSYISYINQRRSLPTEGTFSCDELALSVTFDQDTVVILYPDESEEYVDVDYAAKMYGRSTGVILRYSWFDKQHLIVVVEKGNALFIQGETYSFANEE
jgi:hypothetical protein